METTTTIGEGVSAPATKKRAYTKRDKKYWADKKGAMLRKVDEALADTAPIAVHQKPGRTVRHKKANGRVPITYRRGSWEVCKGGGRWRMKYPPDMNEEMVRKSLNLEYPGAKITRGYTPKNGK